MNTPCSAGRLRPVSFARNVADLAFVDRFVLERERWDWRNRPLATREILEGAATPAEWPRGGLATVRAVRLDCFHFLLRRPALFPEPAALPPSPHSS